MIRPVSFKILVAIPGDTTLDRMFFLQDLLKQALNEEGVTVEDVEWFDTPQPPEGV
jgi:hypothetical protein